MLFNELRLHGKLAAKRHPMYEKNKIGKYIMYASFIFWGAYFIFIGIGLAKAISTEVPNMEAYHILNSGLIFALALDFVIRFPFQKTPTQEVKPYLLLPVKRSRILDFLLLHPWIVLEVMEEHGYDDDGYDGREGHIIGYCGHPYQSGTHTGG